MPSNIQKPKPITEKHKKISQGMTTGFPDYIRDKIINWMHELHGIKNLNLIQWDDEAQWFNANLSNSNHIFKQEWIDDFELIYKCQFSSYPVYVHKIDNLFKKDPDLRLEFLNYIIQDVPEKQQEELEDIFKKVNFEYKVSDIGTEQVYLAKRVPEEVEKVAQEMLNKSDVLLSAWHSVYKKHKDNAEAQASYEHAVKECCKAIEEYITTTYFSQNPKGTFGKLITDLKNQQDKSFYKGINIDSNMTLFDTVKEFQNYSNKHPGQPTPTRKDAEFILHTTIMFLYFIEK